MRDDSLLTWPLWKRLLFYPVVLLICAGLLATELFNRHFWEGLFKMRTVFKLMQAFWVGSPVIFAVMRLVGLVDYGADWLVFAVLSLISFIVVFLTHGR